MTLDHIHFTGPWCPCPLPVQLDSLLPGTVSSCELKAKSWEVASQFQSHVTLSNYGNYIGWVGDKWPLYVILWAVPTCYIAEQFVLILAVLYC